MEKRMNECFIVLSKRGRAVVIIVVVEITAQLPYSYSTLGCCSLVDLLL